MAHVAILLPQRRVVPIWRMWPNGCLFYLHLPLTVISLKVKSLRFETVDINRQGVRSVLHRQGVMIYSLEHAAPSISQSMHDI
jgi:hypothetical protein